MIFGRIDELKFEKSYLPDVVEKVLLFIQKIDFSTIKEKRIVIQDDEIYAVFLDYNTQTLENVKAEVHKKYMDIHYIISGEEKIGVAFKSSKNQLLEKYDEEKDSAIYGCLEHEDFCNLYGVFLLFFFSRRFIAQDAISKVR